MDIYNIPRDDGKTYRLKKFVEYQHEVPEIHFRVLGEYIKKQQLSLDDTIMMCWWLSCTYNELTCILLNKVFNWKSLKRSNCETYCEEFWKKYKEKLLFGSARKYSKNMDWFPILMTEFLRITHKKPYKWIKSFTTNDPIETYKLIHKEIQKIPFVGRFAADIFLEPIVYLKDYLGFSAQEPFVLDWKNCSNLTSGILNIFYRDEEANEYDRTKKLPKDKANLSKYLLKIQEEIRNTYPSQDSSVVMFIGKICSFRNLFKAARYGGFHHDRELGWLREYEKTFPEYKTLWDDIFELRKQMFDPRFLGELNGWDGVRPERKKLWLERGLTGVEKCNEPSKRLLVNIRGTNGSGKSTVPISMKDDPKTYEVIKPYRGKPKKIATVFPSYGWVALGAYNLQVGGLDQFPNKAFTEKVLDYVLRKFSEYNIIMEGILAATTYSTYSDLFKQVQEKYGIQPVIYYLMPPVETCIERIKQRNGGKPFKEELVYAKYRMMQRGIKKFQQAGDFPVLVVDNSSFGKKDVLSQFFANMKEV